MQPYQREIIANMRSDRKPLSAPALPAFVQDGGGRLLVLPASEQAKPLRGVLMKTVVFDEIDYTVEQ